MLRKHLAVITLALLSCSTATSQVGPPRHESRWHHIFFRHREPENLRERYEELRCAMVTISWEETSTIAIPNQPVLTITTAHFGTGFYTSANGTVLTAAHVIGNKSWGDPKPPSSDIIVNLATPLEWKIQNSKNENVRVSNDKLNQHLSNGWGADLAEIETGSTPPCWLRTSDGDSISPGDHVIVLGFPQLAFRSLTLYSGIVSGRLKSDLAIGVAIPSNTPVKPKNDFLRIQMPLSPGLSGSAVIDDENRAVAVVSAAGASTAILDALVQSASIQEAVPLPPGTSRNVDWPLAVGDLAKTLRDYASPGYGDSVPLKYLKEATTPKPTNPVVEPRDHQPKQDHPN